MASQFDSLLDFGDSSTVDSKSTNNQMTDDFDPFSTPSPLDAKGGSGMDLLGEFNFDAQVRNWMCYGVGIFAMFHTMMNIAHLFVFALFMKLLGTGVLYSH